MNQNPIIVIPSHLNLTQPFMDLLPKDIPIIIINHSANEVSCPLPNATVINPQDFATILPKSKLAGYTRFVGSSCRILGHIYAYMHDFDPIIMLDNDCLTPTDLYTKHLHALSQTSGTLETSSNGWINPLHHSTWYSRGYPYESRHSHEYTYKKVSPNVVFNMGLWTNVVDINGIDKTLTPPPSEFKLKKTHTIAGSMLPICAMNNAIRREVIPAYLLIPDITIGAFHLSRHDDIWGGYILKKLIDVKGDHLSYGEPVIYHARESHQPKVLHNEHMMHLLNHHFYSLIDQATIGIDSDSYTIMFKKLTKNMGNIIPKLSLPSHYLDTFNYIHQSMSWYASIFKTS